MLDDSYCCLRGLIFGAKLEWNPERCHGCLKAHQVLWFGGGATHAH